MRLIRLGALIGSVVLLVATTVSMLNNRAETRARQDDRVTAAVEIADQSVESVTLRGLAVVDAASGESDPAAVSRTFGDDAAACIGEQSAQACSGADLLATAAYGEGVRASVERTGPAVVVDGTTDSLLVVDHSETPIALLIPSDALISPSAAATLESYGAVVEVDVRVDRGSGAPISRSGPRSSDGERVVVDVVALPGDGGSVVVTAAVDDVAGLATDGVAMYAALFVLSAVLLGLAGWTFLLDRRTLERRATTDDLTGLPNRREFERLTEEALFAAERLNTGVCVMLIDLNGFKQINDTLGHHFGDLVLRAAAERLAHSVRDSDVVARWGGDEFVVLLPGLQDGTSVRSSAERVAANLGDTPIADGVSITAAIGAALYPRHGVTLDDLVRAADEAMYEAKTTGVSHRLADPLSLAADDPTIHTRSGYAGPDRRSASDRNRV